MAVMEATKADEIKDLEARIEAYGQEVSDLEDQLASAKEGILSDDVEAAVDAVLDEVSRPVGSLICALPNTPAAQRALLNLFDAVGRKP